MMEELFKEFGAGDFFEQHRYPIETSGILDSVSEIQLVSFFEKFECDSYENFIYFLTLFLSIQEKNRHLV
ncbi:hypothetical protein [Peribacillus frigoritolerans]|uniref:hypothetical protein n=1 Tax=Peribacillus frigoritolerans TaxID=450367 RepID=UPI00105A0938|nr:hypothetical protein [Peribacillus frigoritolerans]TDL83013.1 hypothetical protein E2R53_05635 [Peribacillus frigoritolerans]